MVVSAKEDEIQVYAELWFRGYGSLLVVELGLTSSMTFPTKITGIWDEVNVCQMIRLSFRI